MLIVSRVPDSEAHEPGCLQTSGIECEDPKLEYLDIFCDCHRYTELKVLSNGTDIAWPAGWTREQAADWRAARGLKSPSDLTDET